MSTKERSKRWTRGGAAGVLACLVLTVGAPTASAHDAAAQITATQCDVPEHLEEDGDERRSGSHVHEWIEVSNLGDHPVDMSRWMLQDAGAEHTFHFPDGFVLHPGDSVRVRSGHGDDSATDLFWGAGAVWNNDGDAATLRDSDGTEVDREACENEREGSTDNAPGSEPETVEPPVTPPDEPPERICVENLVAIAHGDSSIELSWDPVEDATVYHVHAVVDGEVGELLALVEPGTTSFVHEGLDVGTTYGYAVAAEWHPHGCEPVSATAIPVLPSAVAVALGALGAVGALVALRRR